MLESKFESLKFEQVEIRVEALGGVTSGYDYTYEDSKLVSVQDII